MLGCCTIYFNTIEKDELTVERGYDREWVVSSL